METEQFTPLEDALLLLMRLVEPKKEHSARELWSSLKERASLVTIIRTLEKLESEGYVKIDRPKRRGQKFKVRLTEKAIVGDVEEAVIYEMSFIYAVLRIQAILNNLKKDPTNILLGLTHHYAFFYDSFNDLLFHVFMDLCKHADKSDPKRLLFPFVLRTINCYRIAGSLFSHFFYNLTLLIEVLPIEVMKNFLNTPPPELEKKSDILVRAVNCESSNMLLDVYNNKRPFKIKEPTIFEDQVIEAMQNKEARMKLIVKHSLGGYQECLLKNPKSTDEKGLKEYLELVFSSAQDS